MQSCECVYNDDDDIMSHSICFEASDLLIAEPFLLMF